MDVNKTKVINTTGAGNGLGAASDLEGGDLIIEIARPYILVVEKASLEKVCSECLLETQKLKRCARCKVAHYCSAVCQKTAWTSIHRLECSVLARIPSVPPTPVRALMQILLTHTFAASAEAQWRNLKSNQEHLSKTHRFSDILLQARAACEYARLPIPNALELAIGILCRMSTNAFRATDTGGDPVGLCFEPLIALANHSCSPNAAIIFSGRKIMLRALEPIKEGDQIFVSYIDGTQRQGVRQAELREAYFFDCKCSKCMNQETPYQLWLRSHHGYPNSKLDLLRDSGSLEDFANSITFTSEARVKSVINYERPSDFIDVQSDLRIARETSDTGTRMRSVKRALEILRCFRDVGVFALPPYPAILHELYLYYIECENFSVALSLLLFMQLNCHFYSYPQANHPSNNERLYTIARLSAMMVPSPVGEGNTMLIESRALTNGEVQIPLRTKLHKAITSTDWMSATYALLILVVELAPSSHGLDTRFTKQALLMLDGIDRVQETHLDTTKLQLSQWRKGDLKETPFIKELFEGLRRLGGREILEEIMDIGDI